MDDQRSLEEQLLGDMTYEDPRKNMPTNVGGVDPRLAGASAVVLDDMSDKAPAPPKQRQVLELTEEQIGILQKQRAEKGLPAYTAEEIEALNNEFIERQLATMLVQHQADKAAEQQQAAAALLAAPEEDYVKQEKRDSAKILPQVDASALLEEPAPEPERRVMFNQEDLEAAKKQAAKRAAESLQEAPAKTEEDQKRARRELMELRRQQQEDLAQAGFKQSILLTVLGIVAGIATLLFAMGSYADEAKAPGVFKFFDTVYMICGALVALLSITIVTRVKALRGFTSFMLVITALLLIVPGIVSLLSQKKGGDGFAVTAICYVIAIILCIAVTVMFSSSDKIKAYYTQGEIMYD